MEDLKNDTFPIFLRKNDISNICEFDTHFPKPILLNRPMECCLLEAILPKKIYSLNYMNNDLKNIKAKIVLNINFEGVKTRATDWDKNIISSNYYITAPQIEDITYDITFNTFEELLKQLEEVANEANIKAKSKIEERYPHDHDLGKNYEPIKLYFDKDKNRFFNIHGKYILDIVKRSNPTSPVLKVISFMNIILDEKLTYFLGFEDKLHKQNKDPLDINIPLDPYIAKYSPRFKAEVDIFYLYLDIIKESYIGDQKSNILKIFARNKISNEELVSYHFESNLYIPLRVEEIISIKLSIRNYLGELLGFDEGGILVTLLFRPIEHI